YVYPDWNLSHLQNYRYCILNCLKINPKHCSGFIFYSFSIAFCNLLMVSCCPMVSIIWKISGPFIAPTKLIRKGCITFPIGISLSVIQFLISFSKDFASKLEKLFKIEMSCCIYPGVSSFQFFFAFSSYSVGSTKKKSDNSQKSVTKLARSLVRETTLVT